MLPQSGQEYLFGLGVRAMHSNTSARVLKVVIEKRVYGYPIRQQAGVTVHLFVLFAQPVSKKARHSAFFFITESFLQGEVLLALLICIDGIYCDINKP